MRTLPRQERVAAGLADRCLIQVAYAIGVADPMSLYVDTQGTARSMSAAWKRSCRHLSAAADQHPALAPAQQADLQADRSLRTFRPQAGKGRRLLLGTHRSGAGIEAGFRGALKDRPK